MIIHGGYQRCATTFLQEEIFINLKDYLCLSKPQQSFSAGKRKFYFEEKKNKFRRIYKKIIPFAK